MRGIWRYFLVLSLFQQNLGFCSCLNDEGLALLRFKEEIVSDPYEALANWIDEIEVKNPCSWYGVGCLEGYVVALDLKDLCLRGTMAPEIGNLTHLKSLILRNNSFSGVIAKEIANLKELDLLDLQYNNFSEPLPCHIGSKQSLVVLLLDNNELVQRSHHECKPAEDDLLSGCKRATTSCYGRVMSRKFLKTRATTGRKLLWWGPLKLLLESNPNNIQTSAPSNPSPSPSPSPSSPSPSPSPSHSPLPSPSPSPSQKPVERPPSSSPSNRSSSILPPISEESLRPHAKNSRTNHKLVLFTAIGSSLVLLFLVIGIYVCRRGKVSPVKPWRTGLSGQLQRAFVTGVPKLKRSELVEACEEFSNVIGSSSVCTLYKGTLSSGVEIGVASFEVASKKDWSCSLQAQFRRKIDTLSKVKHKNFISLLGYCEEEKPFTRMLVFEYAPNGTLFEHLHIKEAEHLNWEMRLRIAMGVAYCLDNLHNLTTPFVHRNLTSSSVYLSDDYAAKISDFQLWDKEGLPTPESNVYSFGVLLLEMMTGKLPYSTGTDSHEDWASEFVGGAQTLRESVDPTLTSYGEDQLEQIEMVIKLCTITDPKLRPGMGKVCERLRELTRIEPSRAIPALSPLWWAELEIMSNNLE